MPNPGAFQGSRKVFLDLQKEDYGTAVLNSCVNDALAVIYRKYFKRFPIELPHDQEPSAEHTEAVDDNQPDQDVETPDKESLTAEEYEKAVQGLKDRAELINKRKKVRCDMFTESTVIDGALANSQLASLPIHEGPRERRESS